MVLRENADEMDFSLTGDFFKILHCCLQTIKPQKEMKKYAVKQLLEELIKNGDIEL